MAAFALAAGSASAQQPSGTSQQPAPTPPCGPPITLEQAKRVMAAAELEAAKNSWQLAVTPACTLTCLIHLKSYGTYPAGATFG